MAIFGFGKKKENVQQEPVCACKGAAQAEETVPSGEEMGQAPAGELSSVKVLGSGCKSCHALLENTNEALKKMGVAFEAEYVTDMQKVMAYGVMSTPALVVNEKVVSMGKVMSAAEIEKLFHKIGY